MATDRDPKHPLGRRLLWFAALWIMGTASVASLAYILRLWIAPR